MIWEIAVGIVFIILLLFGILVLLGFTIIPKVKAFEQYNKGAEDLFAEMQKMLDEKQKIALQDALKKIKKQ